MALASSGEDEHRIVAVVPVVDGCMVTCSCGWRSLSSSDGDEVRSVWEGHSTEDDEGTGPEGPVPCRPLARQILSLQNEEQDQDDDK